MIATSFGSWFAKLPVVQPLTHHAATLPAAGRRGVAWAAACLLAALLSACPGAGGGPDSRLPEQWPLPQLVLPRDAEVFESPVHLDRELSDGRLVNQYAVFFTSADQWDEVQRRVERSLRPLGYRVAAEPPEALPLEGGRLSLSAAYASEDGVFFITLLYDMLPQPPPEGGPQAFYTLMLEQRHEPLPPSDEWPVLD